jgi:hypothetical protein
VLRSSSSRWARAAAMRFSSASSSPSGTMATSAQAACAHLRAHLAIEALGALRPVLDLAPQELAPPPD